MIEATLRQLEFRGTFRAYQQTVIDAVEQHSVDGRIHIVAPPGAGKTVIGVELARFFERPAVVFAPTTTIQQQWLETVGMFTGAPTGCLASDDPETPGLLNVLTYQLIATQDHADEDFREAATRLWAETFVDEGHETELAAAVARIAEIRANNPAWHRQELARYRGELRRRMLREDPAALGSILHENAQRLVDDLVGAGVGTVVLDECHHLLDYWALVIRFLVARLADPVVIGLTATPPDPQTSIEEENYYALLGDVDYEVPTPALVREGTLAPYRDLVRFVSPTPEELAFLRQTDERFVEAQRELTGTTRFRGWLRASLFGDGQVDAHSAWSRAVATDALFAFSGLRVLASLDDPALVPEGISVAPIAVREPQFDDWVHVIERFALQVLAPSADEGDHRLQRALKSSLRPFGLTLTERGLRRGRSPVDRIVSLSDAKATATLDILGLEHGALGARLRAAVVCDYDREQARAALAGSHGSGSARGVHGVLARDDRLARALRPVLVTATALAAPTAVATRILELLSRRVTARGLGLRLDLVPADIPGVTRIEARGGAWTPKQYVDLVTELLDEGDVLCLVGTRGLLGEGWDAPCLNVLVDLTTATTAQAVQQLRGRTIRLDPDDGEKVAHNWDVVAFVPQVHGGDNDLQRFLRRHDQTWGIVLGREHERARVALELPMGASLPAPIEKGPRHVDPDLVAELDGIRITPTLNRARVARRVQRALEAATARADDAVPRRAEARAAWAIGGPSDELVTEATRVRLDEPGVRTASYVLATTRSLLLTLGATFLFGAVLALAQAPQAAAATGSSLVAVLAVAFAVGLVSSAGLLVRTMRKLLVEEPADLIVLDIARAVALTLADADLISMNRDTALRSVWCREDRQKQLLVGLTGSGADQRTFAGAMRDVFDVSGDARYLIRRTDERLPSFLSNALWRPLRLLARALGAGGSADHFLAVPRVLARSRKRALAFAGHWSRLVGGGELVDTRDEEAATAILEARSTSRLQALADRLQAFGQGGLP